LSAGFFVLLPLGRLCIVVLIAWAWFGFGLGEFNYVYMFFEGSFIV